MHVYIVVKAVYRHLCFVDPIPVWCVLDEGHFLRNSLCMIGTSDLKTAKNYKMMTEQSANETVISYRWLQSMLEDYSGGSIVTM
jgi:hypothetical protein